MKKFFGLLAMLIFTVTAGQATLILEYRFDEAASGTINATDSGTPPLWDGKFYGTATRISTGLFGHNTAALDLTPTGAASVGTVNALNLPDDADKIDTLGKMTITFWMNLKAAPIASTQILSTRTVGGAAGGDGWWAVGFQAFGGTINQDRLRLTFGIGSNNDSFNVFSAQTDGLGSAAGNGNPYDTSDNWVFYALTYDSTLAVASAAKFYAGLLTGTVASVALGGTTGTPAVPTQNLTDLRVGIDARFPTDAVRKVPGYLDNVRIYNTILTQSQLEQLRFADVIPEPSTVFLLGIGGAWLGRRALGKRSCRA